MKLSVEHKVLGASTTDRGDGVLSVTSNISERGSILLSDFLDSTSLAPEDHASMLFFHYPSTGLYTIIHYQAKFTAFPEHNRWYDERALYELNPSEFEKIKYSYLTLLPSLNKFGEYTTRHFDVSNEVEIYPSGHVTPAGNVDEQTLKNAIIQSVLNNKKVFIQLGESDKVKGDAIRNTSKLKTLLGAIAQLPESWRKHISAAFGVENHALVFGRIASEILVYAIFDKTNDWGELATDTILIDWTGTSPKGDIKNLDEQKLAVVSLLLPIYSDRDISSTQYFATLVGAVAGKANEFPNLTLSAVKSLSREDITAIETWFRTGEKTYRHKDISLRLLWLSALGRTQIPNNAILEKYPDLKNDQAYTSLLRERLNYSNDFHQLADIYKNNKDVSTICNAIFNIVSNNSELIDACANNPATDLAKDMRDKIRESAKKWGEDSIIARLDKPYFGLSLEKSFNIKSWTDYNRLYIKMENRRDINKLPCQINWPDAVPAELFKKIQNRFSKNDCATLYDKIAPAKATLNDLADLACNYGEKFFPFIKDDINNALPPTDNNKLENDVMSLLNSSGSKEIGELIKKKHLSHSTNDLSGLIATLKNDCSDFLLRQITEEKIGQAIESENNLKDSQLVAYLNDLYSIHEKRLIKKRDLILQVLADEYLHKELLSETPLTSKSFWNLLYEPQKSVLKWFKIVSDRIFGLSDHDKKTLRTKIIEYYSNLDKNEQYENVSKEAQSFVLKSSQNLVKALQESDLQNDASALKSALPKSGVLNLVQRTQGMGKKWILISGITLAIVIGIIVAIILLARGCKKPIDSQPKPQQVSPVDTLYYRMLIGDTITNSTEWEHLPLGTTHPILLFANKYLDTLYIHPVSALVEMRTSTGIDSNFHLTIGSDSIWFISRLLPIWEYYDFVCNKLHKESTDTSSLQLKCIDRKRPRDTIQVTVNNSNPLLKQILANDTLKGCNVVSCNGVAIDNTVFQQRNGHLRTLGRTDYYLWIIQQIDSLNKHH